MNILKSIAAAMLLLPATAQAQLQVDTLQGQQLGAFLQGNGLTISNLVVNCPDSEFIGTFNGANSNIGISQGLVMSTGTIYNLPGPNSSGSTTSGGYLNSDLDMDAITTINTYDVCIIEFDATPQFNNIMFNYAFGSEEYPEYECSPFNDAFAFLVSGPGIVGPYSNNAKNVALVPSTNTPVAINTVNSGSAASTQSCDAIDANWMNYNIYYVDNANGTTVELDGFTTNLTAAISLNPNDTYHFKIAVADAADAAFDSAVFLQAGSFRSIAGPTDVNESAIINSVLAFPNPAEDHLNVQYTLMQDERTTIKLTDLLGRTVYVQEQEQLIGGNTLTINTESISEGIYLLDVAAGTYQHTEKVMIK
jgi:hypothetical protein